MLPIAVIGIGSLRFGPPVLAVLSQFPAEWPLEIRLFDPDADRLQTFGRLARSFLGNMQAGHSVETPETVEETLQGCYAGLYCPIPHLPEWSHPVAPLPAVLRLKSDATWPELRSEPDVGFAFQLLRWIHMEESPVPYIRSQASPEIKEWLLYSYQQYQRLPS